MAYFHQDWNEVILKPVKSKADAQPKAKSASTSFGPHAKKNASKATLPYKNTAVLAADTETFAHDTVRSELKHRIQTARLAAKLTQAQLANMIRETPRVVNDYEAGRAIPHPEILQKMSRVLGVTLKK